MTSRRLQTWVWWLLPLLVARALMPVGFMARMQEGQLQVVFCSGGSIQLRGSDHAVSASATSHDDAQHDASQDDLSCPFAQVAAAPLPQAVRDETIPFISTAEILQPADSPYYAAGPPRFIATRGPPISL